MRVSRRLSTLPFLVSITVLTGAQGLSAQDAKQPELVTEERVAGEGRVRLRELYLAERRQKPADSPDFNIAQARLQAVQLRQAIEALGRAPYVSPTTWTSIGPAPINGGQTPTSSPRYPSDVSGRVSALAIDATDNAVFAGGAQGGVWKTTDNGATWTPLTDNLGSLAIGAIAIDPAPHSVGQATLYIGTGEGNGSCDSYAGVGVYKSVDSGATWSGPYGAAQFTNRAVNSIAVDRTNPLHVLATSASGIWGVSCGAGLTSPTRGVFESVDGGLTWTQRTAANRRFSVVLQDPLTATTWWAAGWTSTSSIDPANEGGLVKSIDNGASWNQVAGTGGLPALSTSFSRGWITATTDGLPVPVNSVLYFGYGASSGTVYKSVNSGVSWTLVPAAAGYCDGQCFYDLPIYVEPGNPNVFYTGGAGQSGASLPTQFMRSDNGGTSFLDKVRSADATTAQHADVHAITTWPGQPNRLWVGNDGGVWRSDDRGDNWIDVNQGLALTQFSGGDLHPTNRGMAYAGSQDNGTQGWQGSVYWKHLDYGDGGFALIDQSNPNNLVHTYYNQSGSLVGVGYTTAGFTTTMGFYTGSFAPGNGISISDRVLFYAPLHLDRGKSDTLYYGTHRLWRASTFFATGGGFAAVDPAQDLTGGSGAVSAIETFANPTPGVNADIIYTGSSSGRVYRTTNATSGTPTWTQVDVAGPTRYVSDVVIDPTNSNVVYHSRAGFAGAAGQNVRKSVDGGATWNPAGAGIPDIPVNALAIDPVTPNKIWAGTDIGIYVSTDGGTSWVPYNAGFPNVAVFDLKANGTTKQLAAFTHGRGAFVLSLDNDLIFRDGF